jgi:beta-galactosidase
MPVKLDDERARGIYAKYLTALIPAVKSPDTLLALCLGNEAIYFDYNDFGKEATERFRRYLEEKYTTIANLNSAWDTNYGDFATASAMISYTVAMPEKGDVTPGQWHDWMSFNQYRVTRFFSWLQGIIKANDGTPFTHIKVPGVTYNRSGVEGEAISDLCDLSGLDNGCEYPDKKYAFDFMRGMMAYDFYRSINPQKPIADTEMHFSAKANLPEEYFYAQIFLSYLHGVDLSGIWVWNRNLKMYRSILAEPKRMHGMGKAALDLRRLANYVTSFQNQKASIGILWAQSTSVSQRASEYRRALDEAYENIYFLNIPTDFVTEKRILDTKISDYKILLVPSAFYVKDEVFDEIQAFAERGGIVLLSGEGALSCNEYGRKRDISGLLQLHTVRELSDPKELYVAVKGDLEKAGIKSDIVLDVKTATNSEMANTVEYRSIVCDSRLICYAINLGKEKIKVALRDKDGKVLTQSKDLISGRQFEGEIPLASMEVVMLDVGPAVKTE